MPTADEEDFLSRLLTGIGRTLSAEVESGEIIRVVLGHVKSALYAESASLLLLTENGEELYFPIARDRSLSLEMRLEDLRVPVDQGIAGSVLSDGRAIHVPDVSVDPRHFRSVDEETGAPTTALLCAPLRADGKTLGVIQVRNPTRGHFRDGDLALLERLAEPIAMALRSGKSADHLRRSEARLRAEVGALRQERRRREGFHQIVGSAPSMQQVFSLMEAAIPTDVSVLVQGETGTGKEQVARAIHAGGERKDAPFVAVNCGAVQDELLASELFGHRKGSFTGAQRDKTGLFEAADGGTLFLDEIGDTSPAMQVELLRVLQEGEIRRVGDTMPRTVDVRVVFATHRDLEREIEEGRFREDLFYRISVFPIRVPPLRERMEDLPLLVTHFLERMGERLPLEQAPRIRSEALAQLHSHDWPGNVRELENEIERAAILAGDGEIGVECLSPRVRGQMGSPRGQRQTGSLKEAREAFERDCIRRALEERGGNATRAAEALGLSRQMLQRKIKQYGLRE